MKADDKSYAAILNNAKREYYIECFVLDKPYEEVDRRVVMQIFDRILIKNNLRVDSEVSYAEYADNAKSVEIGRYCRVPKGYIDYVEDTNSSDRVPSNILGEYPTIDPLKGGDRIKLEDAYHHADSLSNIRYMSLYYMNFEPVHAGNGEKLDKKTIIRINYNKRLRGVAPIIEDAVAYLGISLTKHYNTSGLYMRATATSREAEQMLYYHNGEKRHEFSGKGTFDQVRNIYGLQIDNIMDVVDYHMLVLNTPHDLSIIEEGRQQLFRRWKISPGPIMKRVYEKYLPLYFKDPDIHRLRILCKSLLVSEGEYPDHFPKEDSPQAKDQRDTMLVQEASVLADLLHGTGVFYTTIKEDPRIEGIYFKIHHHDTRRYMEKWGLSPE